jgi:hypothetical protein
MMNSRAAKLIFLSFAMMFADVRAFAADTCTICPQIDEIIKHMDKVVCDPLNSKTISEQDQITGEVLEILQKNLNEKSFNSSTAKPIVKMIARALCYDNALDFEQATMSQFRKLYGAPNSLLRSTIDQMKESGEISSKEQHDMVDYYGVLHTGKRAEKKSDTTRKPARVNND